MAAVKDKELALYHDLVQVPDQYEDGFNLKTLVGALLLGFLMLPASIYLGLFMGQGLGPAARWVTLIIFAEIAKRSMKSLKKQEIYVLFAMSGVALSSPFSGLLWNQYLVQATPVNAMGIDIPWWVAPSAQSIEAHGRTFFTMGWLGPILFVSGMLLISRIDHFGLGYALYRLTAHAEKLPFPMAPVGAMGITALAEADDPKERWRWRMFATGAVIGLGFGLVYVGVPAITGALFARPVEIIPIPFLDLTPGLSTVDRLPATPLNLVFDLGLVFLGMVLPFWAVIGGFVGLVVTWILNPVLYQNGMLTGWQPGNRMIDTMFVNTVDFYLSFGIGLSLAIFIVSIWPIVRPLSAKLFKTETQSEIDAEQRGLKQGWKHMSVRNRNRGDISIWLSLAIYVFSTLTYIAVSCWLMWDYEAGQTRFPWIFFLGFGFIYQPMISYVNAKLEGLVGQTVQIPLVREAAFILSGYRGAEIWFAPIPMNDYAGAVQGFRVMELTGTKLTSVIKVEFLTIPIVIVASLLFSQLIWRLAPIPSEQYPFAQELWELQALNFSLTTSSTMEGSSMFMEAIKPNVIGWGAGTGLGLFMLLSFLNLPVMLVYGIVRGLGQTTPGNVIPEVIGALIARYYLEKKFGQKQFKQYITVLLAGYGAGVGLIGMMSVGFALIAKSSSTLGY